MHKPLLIPLLSLLLAACGGGNGASAPANEANTAAAAASSPASAAPTATIAAPPDTATARSTRTPAEPTREPAGAQSAAASQSAAEPAAETSAGDEPPTQARTEPAPTDSGKWVEGKNYFLIEPQQPKLSTSDKIQVVEVFSYGCPACNSAHAFMQKLAKSLPDDAEMDYLPVSFRPDENFPLYQRAFYTAQALGVARKAHDAMFDAVWKSGEIGTYNISTGRPKPHDDWPDIQDIAKFYARYGVDPAQFVATSKSFAINTKMKRADQLIKNWQVMSTPSLVIDGKYRYTANSAGGYQQMLEMTDWLVRREHQARQTGN